MRFFNIRLFKVGGIWFLKLGRINLAFSVSRAPGNAIADDVRLVNAARYRRALAERMLLYVGRD